MNSISHIRSRLGVTQSAMAEGIGVTQGNVSNYENGQSMPDRVARRLIVYAKSLGHNVTFDDIYAPPASVAAPIEAARAGRNPPSRTNVMTAEINQPAVFTRRAADTTTE